MGKHFRLTAEEIKLLVPGYGSCLASDRITVDGMPVGYMYKEAPHSEWDDDSGWRFFAGDESQAYSDDASNFALYHVEYDRQLRFDDHPFLVGSSSSAAYGRSDTGQWLQEEPPVDPGSA
jgi:hypothetical protein